MSNESSRSSSELDDSILTPEDLVERAQKDAGVQALEQVAEKHISRIIDVRENFPIDDVDLLSTNVVRNRDLPEQIKREVVHLQARMRSIIEAVATRIEDRKYQSSEEAIQEMGLAYNQREKIMALLHSDKQVHIAYQSLKIAVEVFSELNRRIIQRIDESQKAGDIHGESNLVLVNAVLVYELTDFLVSYIEQFEVQGVDEITRLYEDELKRTNKLRAQQAELREQANSEEIEPEVREQILSDIQDREDSIDLIAEEWNTYIEEIKDTQQQASVIDRKLPTLRLIRSNAINHIELMEAMAVLAVMRKNLSSIEAAVSALEKIELASLSPARVRRFLGLKQTA